MPRQFTPTILENRRLTGTIFALRMTADGIEQFAAPGQFLHIKCQDSSILRRPVSICDVSGGVLTVTAEIRGAGTAWLSERQAGERLDVLGPLGQGFELKHDNIIIVGGGIGAAPMLFAARTAGARTAAGARAAGHAGAAVLGFRTRDAVILEDEFRTVCTEVYITTDDGSFGEAGTVAGPLERLLAATRGASVLACGPRPMLKAVAALSAAYGASCQVSLEERMGCGVGACLVCACRTLEDGQAHMRRVCKDGPVFNAEEVVW